MFYFLILTSLYTVKNISKKLHPFIFFSSMSLNKTSDIEGTQVIWLWIPLQLDNNISDANADFFFFKLNKKMNSKSVQMKSVIF